MRNVLGMLFACLVIFGCATMPATQSMTVNNTFQLDSDFNSSWKATMQSLVEKKVSLKISDKDTGIITSDIILFEDMGFRFADDEIQRISVRPSQFMAVWKAGKYSYNIFLTSIEPKKTEIKIVLNIEAHSNIDGWHSCQSKGVLEQALYDSIVSKLKR